MKPPRLPQDYEDRDIDCREAIEDEFLALVDRAYTIGWYPKETMIALGELALDRLRAVQANEQTDRQIAEGLTRRRKTH
ncbi:hypothetical protein EON80_10085 [bacterium]|nr:MAG: hypothetical protein EON80_10085 [bacterium]